MIEPLRKLRGDGQLYHRRTDTELKLSELEMLTREELVQRARIGSKSDPEYLTSECLLHFVRRSRTDNSDRHFEILFRILFARVEHAATLREGLHYLADGRPALSKYARDVRDDVIDRFVKRLMQDRGGYEARLDYFEVNFNHAIASLRSTAKRKFAALEQGMQPLSTNDDEEVSAEVEKAASSFNPFDREKIDDGNYRLRLIAAIRELPVKERHVVVLLFKEYPIESALPDRPDICSILGCVEKTVRNRRDRAFAKLRTALSEDLLDV